MHAFSCMFEKGQLGTLVLSLQALCMKDILKRVHDVDDKGASHWTAKTRGIQQEKRGKSLIDNNHFAKAGLRCKILHRATLPNYESEESFDGTNLGVSRSLDQIRRPSRNIGPLVPAGEHRFEIKLSRITPQLWYYIN